MHIIYNDLKIKVGIDTNDVEQILANMEEGDKVVEMDITNISAYTVINGEIVKRPEDSEAIAKAMKYYLVSQIKVTTSLGNTFDGDEISQDRMTRAISISLSTGKVTTRWKLANNTIIEVGLEELREALALTGEEMSKIWLGE